ncbi:MAG: hypothetical protein N2689_04105, partial [Verrucomicrobiae bacterium]|nr:hypothetical protein [Verrucomicrobiae bacterium]
MTESFDDLLRRAEELHARNPDRERRGRLGLYESFLRHERRRLRQRHGLGAGGREIARAHAALADAVLRHLFGALLSSWSAEHPKQKPPAVALVGLGGYGRGELNPFSDIDLLALHEDSRRGRASDAFLRAIHDGLVVPFYDLGFHVGWTTRSVRQTLAQANKDMETKTSLIEARFLAGERSLFEELQAKLLQHCVRPCVEEYIEQRMKDQAARHAKFDNKVSVQEPNIKSGCGGLRDLQNLLWMSFFKHGTRTLEEMVARGFLTRDEQQSLETAYDFLLRARTQLHYVAERPMDVLTLALQDAVATGLRYEEPDPLRRVERFMRDYYRHARHVFQLTNALALRMALKPPGYFERLGLHVPILRRGTRLEKKDGFIFRGNVIEPQSREIFREDPFRILRVFRHAQQRQAFLSPELQALVREYLRSVNE